MDYSEFYELGEKRLFFYRLCMPFISFLFIFCMDFMSQILSLMNYYIESQFNQFLILFIDQKVGQCCCTRGKKCDTDGTDIVGKSGKMEKLHVKII